jgi:DNA-binding MarR family transcriptional regulator
MDFISLFNELYNKFMDRYFESKTYKEYFSNMSYKEIQYLSQIHRYGKISLVELSKKMGVSKSAVTQIVNKLIVKGYIEKNKSQIDKRECFVSLTSEFCELFRKNDLAMQVIFDDTLKNISKEEQNQLTKILIKINNNI